MGDPTLDGHALTPDRLVARVLELTERLEASAAGVRDAHEERNQAQARVLTLQEQVAHGRRVTEAQQAEVESLQGEVCSVDNMSSRDVGHTAPSE